VQLSIVLSELIRNSSQALQSAGGTIEIRAVARDDAVQIEIEDHGQGFSEHERTHAFDPFFSGRQAGRGLGFGLPKCWQIVRQHQGTIEILSPPRDSTANPVTIVRMTWPLAKRD
jgi:signal transduction histidine kinase